MIYFLTAVVFYYMSYKYVTAGVEEFNKGVKDGLP